ncbi:hypothetical protein JCM9140_3232 [Halalkalibacter wakoensis JCM 9140]|uniref:Uncharacterized protein n=1 Tax=Halalkalibacter wakoensis JCM 9140 TaxID=1236970 RepID=W4Q4V1_9BACI|nr:hypothetical protein [Halalkalibacter wakoensis]GAE27116.1 hypothetical protein JCM9140_3232 [Halalkalibacter wakoensis JCM 9140]
MHINPMLNQKKKDVSRRTRSDKKRDIKIPVTKDEKEFIIRASIERRETETEYCTKVLKTALSRHSEFYEVEYQNLKDTVHVKVDVFLEEQIAYYAALWGCRSIRKVAHRIFMQELRLERGEIIFEGI